MDETHFPPYRDRFDGVVAHVEVKDRAGIGQDVPEGTRGLDDRVGAFVLEPGNARRHVHFGQVRVKGDELYLCAVPNPDPASVGNDQLRHSPAS